MLLSILLENLHLNEDIAKNAHMRYDNSRALGQNENEADCIAWLSDYMKTNVVQ
jgi:hypothetical protein